MPRSHSGRGVPCSEQILIPVKATACKAYPTPLTSQLEHRTQAGGLLSRTSGTTTSATYLNSVTSYMIRYDAVQVPNRHLRFKPFQMTFVDSKMEVSRISGNTPMRNLYTPLKMPKLRLLLDGYLPSIGRFKPLKLPVSPIVSAPTCLDEDDRRTLRAG